jgi:hypothetical protein
VLVLKIDQRIMKGIKVQKRQLLLLAAAGFLGMAGRANGQKPLVLEQRAMPETKAVELTLLRSIDADPTLAAQFIKANWFAMDAIAKARGLMTFFNLMLIQPRARIGTLLCKSAIQMCAALKQFNLNGHRLWRHTKLC